MRNRILGLMLVGVVAGLMLPSLAQADEYVYWSQLNGNTLNKYDVTTSTNQLIDNTPGGNTGQPDSLIFSGNNLVYSYFTRNCCSGYPGSVRMLSPGQLGGTDSLVAGGFSYEAVDLTLDPKSISAGAGYGADPTVVLSDRNDEGGGAGWLQRIDLVTGAHSTLAALPWVDGTAYNGTALYVNAGALGSQKVMQIDPLTGAVINAGDPNFNVGFLDGLTYDPVSNLLYAANGLCLQTFDPTTLKAGACVGSFLAQLDGVETDGHGNILVAEANYGVGIYNIGAGTSSTLFVANGIDDIAPVFGGGAPPPPSPEPATLSLLGIGLAGLLAKKRRSK